MTMIDFEFNEETLSDHNLVIGYISGADDSVPLSSPMIMNTVKVGDRNKIVSRQYDDVITKTFTIVKSPCYSNGKDIFFTDDELYEISAWLQSKDYYKFKPIYDDGSFPDIHFYGRFDINAIYGNGSIIGLELTLTTDSPYGYGEEQEVTYSVSSDNSEFRVFNDSQEYGYLYFEEFNIKCNSSGTFKMTNDNDISLETGHAYQTRIENCLADENITIDCQHKIITTDNSTHEETLFDDFNWNYPRLVCDYVSPLNVFTVDTSLLSDAEITVKFSPIRKVGVI